MRVASIVVSRKAIRNDLRAARHVGWPAVPCFLMPSKNILELLKRWGPTINWPLEQVGTMISKNLQLFPKLIVGLWSKDRLVRMRAADAAEKVTRKNPELLAPYRKELLGLLGETKEQELRWHLAVMVPRLALNSKERQRAISLLNSYMQDRSSIVKTFALQGLADLAHADATIRSTVIEILREATRSGTPA